MRFLGEASAQVDLFRMSSESKFQVCIYQKNTSKSWIKSERNMTLYQELMRWSEMEADPMTWDYNGNWVNDGSIYRDDEA